MLAHNGEMEMVAVAELISKLRCLDVHLWVKGDALHYNAPKGALSQEILDEISSNKTAIVDYLRTNYGYQGEEVQLVPQIQPSPADKHFPFPLNDMQRAYWIGRNAAFEMGNIASHVYVELETYSLDLGRFERAWQQLIDRHDVLRTVLRPDGQQQIKEQVPRYTIQVLDLRNCEESHVRKQLAALRSRFSHQILPLTQWPPFEVLATRIGDHQLRIHISIDNLLIDGWSYNILMRELVQVYNAPDQQLPELELSFRDYVLAEVNTADTVAFGRSLTYWKSRLLHLPPAPQLPLAKLPDSHPHPHFVRRSMHLDYSIWPELKSRAARAGLAVTGLLLATYAEILGLWSKSQHFTISIPHFNRLPLHPQVKHIVGQFASFSLLEVDNTGRDPFVIRARRLQDRLWRDLEYQHISGVRILRELSQLHGNVQTSMPVVFTSLPSDIVGAHETTGARLSDIGDVVFSIAQTPQVWLDLRVAETDNGLSIDWDIVEEMFPVGLANDMFEAYCQLLYRLASEERTWQDASLGLIPPTQLEQRLRSNAKEIPISSHMLHTLFMQQARQRAQHVAVVAAGCTLTYGELEQRSLCIGHRLRQLGARPNKLVAIVMEKGWEQIVAVLGVLFAGAAYVPIDPAVPVERLAHLLEHSMAQVVLTQSTLSPRLDWPKNVSQICVDALDYERESHEPIVPRQQPEDLAYVIYTSGSTGLPKGVMITHRGAVNAIVDTNSQFNVTSQDSILALTALHHDMSVYDIFGILAVGGSIVMPELRYLKDPSHWISLLLQEKITIWNSVPAMMQMLIGSSSKQVSLLRKSSLRLAFIGGDWIPVTLADRMRDLVPNLHIISVGGPTETTLWNIRFPIEGPISVTNSIPYGQPIANNRYYVFNERLDDCPVWVPGELYCAGIGLAKGYWREDENNSARFIQHPRTEERLFRTGDLGRYLPDGNIEFLGRIDYQIKIHGQRIEPGEIEVALERHPNIFRAIVSVLGEQQGNRRLVAYVVAESKVLPRSDDLRAFLKMIVPEYMVPSTFVFLGTLPLTPNGKVDRRNLPIPTGGTAASRSAHRAPSTKSEKLLAGIWCDVLGLTTVSMDDNFFALGGDSVLCIQIVARSAELGLSISVQQFLEHQNIADLGKLVDSAAPSRVEQNRASSVVPLTPIQHLFFEQEQLEWDGCSQGLVLQLCDQARPELLEEALRHVELHHDAFRLRFQLTPDGQSAMITDTKSSVALTLLDFSSLDLSAHDDAIRAYIAQTEASLDLSTGPLMYAVLIEFGPRPQRLLLVIHQLIIDEISWRIILEDLQSAYAQLCHGEIVSLPANSTSIKQWADCLRQLVVPASLAFDIYSSSPRSFPPTNKMPVDWPNGVDRVESVASIQKVLETTASEILFRDVLQTCNVDIITVLLVALGQAFRRCLAQNVLLVDVQDDGRVNLPEGMDLTRIVGRFTSFYPAFVDLRSNHLPIAALKMAREDLRQQPYGGVAYGVLKYLCNDPIITSHLLAIPQAEICLVYRGHFNLPSVESPLLRLASGWREPTRKPTRLRRHHMEVEGSVAAGRLCIRWLYRSNYFQRDTIERLAEACIEALHQFIDYRQEAAFSPSDFPNARLNQRNLNHFISTIRGSEGVNGRLK